MVKIMMVLMKILMIMMVMRWMVILERDNAYGAEDGDVITSELMMAIVAMVMAKLFVVLI